MSSDDQIISSGLLHITSNWVHRDDPSPDRRADWGRAMEAGDQPTVFQAQTLVELEAKYPNEARDDDFVESIDRARAVIAAATAAARTT